MPLLDKIRDLPEKVERNAKRLAAIGVITTTVGMGTAWHAINRVEKLREDAPQVARIDDITKELSRIDGELGGRVYFRDALILTNIEEYLPLSQKKIQLQKEYDGLMRETEVKKFLRYEKYFHHRILPLAVIPILPLSLGVGGMISRRLSYADLCDI